MSWTETVVTGEKGMVLNASFMAFLYHTLPIGAARQGQYLSSNPVMSEIHHATCLPRNQTAST